MQIMHLKTYSETQISSDLEALSWGPFGHGKVYNGCVINRVRFVTTSREVGLKTQNSGVSVVGEHNGKQISFYGLLTDVVQLNYFEHHRVFLFKCKWFDTHRDGSEEINEDMKSIWISRTWYDNDPYVLADMCQ